MPIVFHNGFKYDYQFIIKELVGELEQQFTCLIENTEKHRTFFILNRKRSYISQEKWKRNYKNHILQIKIYS